MLRCHPSGNGAGWCDALKRCGPTRVPAPARKIGHLELQRLAPRRRPLRDHETVALVQAECAGRVVGVDAEDPGVHAAIADGCQRSVDEHVREAALTPWTPREHAVKPAALNAEHLVLCSFDGVDDTARDLITVPRDDPQRWIESRPREEAPEV